MLPKELIRYRIEGDFIFPKYITRKQSEYYLRVAKDLIQIYQNNIGKTQQELENELLEYEGERLNYKILRGFTNILHKHFIIQPTENMDFPSYREHIFSYAEKLRPIVRTKDLIHKHDRQAVLSQLYPNSPSDSAIKNLYGDIKANQVLIGWQKKIDPIQLVRRYNLELAQGILYRAESIIVNLEDSFKIVFKYLKLARLMHSIHLINNGYQIVIDGPFSILNHTTKYGTNLALFLPALLLANKWEMQAKINLKGEQKLFYLNNDCGLYSHYQNENPFDSSVEKAFFKKFSRKMPDWQIERETELINLGETVFIPDFTIFSPSSNKFLLEIVGFWTPEYLQKKIKKINQAKRSDLLIVVNQQLKCSREDFYGQVLFYKNRVNVDEVIEVLLKFDQNSKNNVPPI